MLVFMFYSEQISMSMIDVLFHVFMGGLKFVVMHWVDPGCLVPPWFSSCDNWPSKIKGNLC